jgi:uncharacterized membrane protein YeaQ/YmgE (transglycosylase-associated protein family)
MNLLIYLIVAAVIGWLASEIMRDRASLMINIVVGVVGAFVAGWFLTPIFGVPSINSGTFNAGTMLVTLAGAVIVIWVVHLLRRRV